MIDETLYQPNQLNKYPASSFQPNQVSVQSILNDLKTEFNINSPLASTLFVNSSPAASAAFSMPFSTKISQYKMFVNQLDDAILQISKQAARIVEIFKEFQKCWQHQSQLESSLFEPLLNLGKLSNNLDMNFMLEKFNELAQNLNENTKNFFEKFSTLSSNSFENQAIQENEMEKEATRRSLEKALKLYETKCNNLNKHKKNQKSYDFNSEKLSVLNDEKSLLSQKLLQHLIQINKCKTSSYNNLTTFLIDFHRTQLDYHRESHELLNSYMAFFDKPQIEKLTRNLNLNQKAERDSLEDILKKLSKAHPVHMNGSGSTTNLRYTSTDDIISSPRMSYTTAALNQQSPHIEKNGGNGNFKKSTDNIFSFFSTSSQIFGSSPTLSNQKKKLLSNSTNATGSFVSHMELSKNGQNLGSSKVGYLLKRSYHSRMRKHWLKRKCQVENGGFFIYHNDENKEPVRLNLITCQMKVIDSKRFKVFSGSNSRVYDFTAENENDLKDWITVLNNSKNEAFDREFSENNGSSGTSSHASMHTNGLNGQNDDSEQPLADLIDNIIKKIKKLEGNNRCCDCGSTDSDWLVTNLGVLVCIECCGIHRELGVQVSKTQSLKIDRLSTSQLIIARMVGNKTFNRIFEANLDKSQKLQPNSNMETRRRYIKLKYEQHAFVNFEYPFEKLYEFVSFAKFQDRANVVDLLLQLFAQNIDLMLPLPNDLLKRNLIQLALINFEEVSHLYIIDFIVQNRDFGKKGNLNYQDLEGNTALHYCAYYNRVETIKILLKANINIDIRNNHGQTAYDIAENLKNYDCLKQLNLVRNGKPVNKIDWIFLFDEDYFSDEDDFSSAVNKSKMQRPVSMIFGEGQNQLIERTSFAKNEVDNGDLMRENGSYMFKPNKHYRNPSDPLNLMERSDEVKKSSAYVPKGAVKVLPKYFEMNQKEKPMSLSNRQLNKISDPKAEESDANQQMNAEESVCLVINGNNPNSHNLKAPLQRNGMYYPRPFKCKAVFDFDSNEPTELAFKQNDVIIVIDSSDSNNWLGYIESRPEKHGYFPPSLVYMYV